MQITIEQFSRRRTYLAGVAMAFAVLVLPLCAVNIPPIADYPNHLARMWILATGAHDLFLSTMYTSAWHIIPNVAVDLVIPPLVGILPLYLAGRLMLAGALLLPVIGVLALHRVLHGRWSLWPLSVCLIAYNWIFLAGFINFLIGVGIAFLLEWRCAKRSAY